MWGALAKRTFGFTRCRVQPKELIMGTASQQAPLWDARAQDWADVQEGVVSPLYLAVLQDTAVGPRTALLDVGCGAGGFCRLARAQGATVSGLDASPALLAIARHRVPEGRFIQGEMEDLPYADHSFDLVTGFNSFQYAADPIHALTQARRVTRPGGAVVIAVWGQPEVTEAAALLMAIGSLLPPPPPGSPGPFALSSEGALAALAKAADLTPVKHGAAQCPWHYEDEQQALRGLLSSGPVVGAIAAAGQQAVEGAVRRAIAPFKRQNGTVEMQNVFLYLVATA
jgi:SAM-dependent methyltransferase